MCVGKITIIKEACNHNVLRANDPTFARCEGQREAQLAKQNTDSLVEAPHGLEARQTTDPPEVLYDALTLRRRIRPVAQSVTTLATTRGLTHVNARLRLERSLLDICYNHSVDQQL